MATVPNPTTAGVLAKLTASIWNASVRDSINFFLNPPRCTVTHSASTSPATSAFTLQPFDTEPTDTDTMHDPVTNNSRLVATTRGTYLVIAQVQFVANAAGIRAVQLRKNAGGVAGAGTFIAQNNSGLGQAGLGTAALVVKDVPLLATDYLEVFIFQSSGGALATVQGDGLTYASMRLVSSP